ncbi:MAG TPA: hypothetical protein VGN81_10935 [Pseudonocardiaceae bacterium]
MLGGRGWRNLWMIVGLLLAVGFSSWLVVVADGLSAVLALGAVVAHGFLNRKAPWPVWRYSGSAFVLAAFLLGTVAAQDLILTTSGREETAVVVGMSGYEPKTGRYTTYSLDTLSGTPIDSQFEPDDGSSYAVGEQLTVFADPSGKIDPEPSYEVNAPVKIVLGALALVLATISQILMWRPRRVADPRRPA